MPTYILNEQSELSALDNGVQLAQTAAQLPTGDIGAAFAKMFISLVVLVVLLFVTYWFLKRLIRNRLQKGVGNASIQILEKKMISPKTMLYLIEVDQKKILFAESHLEIKRLEGFVERLEADSKAP